MQKSAKIIFLLVACIFPIFIGVLHTATHFSDLVTPEIKVYLQEKFIILGQAQSLWNTWGIVSFMMGVSFIVIGLLNISMYRGLAKTQHIPLLTIIAMLFYQSSVIYVGYEFEQAFQFYGGIFGNILLLICLFLTQKVKATKS